MALASSELENVFKDRKAVGASTVTVIDGAIASVETFGFSNSAKKTEVDSNTRFQAASISKTINAVAILTLVESGELDIDAPVNTYLTQWQLLGQHADKVTIKHLLSHCGGTTVHGFDGYGQTDAIPSTLEILSGSPNANSAAVVSEDPPNKKYRYSGGGTTILQALLEELMGMSYDEFILKSVFQPANMCHSGFSASSDLEGFSCAHTNRGKPILGDYRRYPEKAAAGLWTTPSDIANLLISLMRSAHSNQGSILSKELAVQMMTPVIKNSGLGVFITPKNQIVHSGSNYGFRSLFSFDLNTGNGVVAMSNSERGARTPHFLITAIQSQNGWA